MRPKTLGPWDLGTFEESTKVPRNHPCDNAWRGTRDNARAWLGGVRESTAGAVHPLAYIVSEARAWLSIVFWPWLVYFQRPPSTITSQEETTT
jgi:hypothetical protein